MRTEAFVGAASRARAATAAPALPALRHSGLLAGERGVRPPGRSSRAGFCYNGSWHDNSLIHDEGSLGLITNCPYLFRCLL